MSFRVALVDVWMWSLACTPARWGLGLCGGQRAPRHLERVSPINLIHLMNNTTVDLKRKERKLISLLSK